MIQIFFVHLCIEKFKKKSEWSENFSKKTLSKFWKIFFWKIFRSLRIFFYFSIFDNFFTISPWMSLVLYFTILIVSILHHNQKCAHFRSAYNNEIRTNNKYMVVFGLLTRASGQKKFFKHPFFDIFEIILKHCFQMNQV